MTRYYFYKATVMSGDKVLMKHHGIINTDDYKKAYKDPIIYLDGIIINEVHQLMDDMNQGSSTQLGEDFDIANYEVIIDSISRL